MRLSLRVGFSLLMVAAAGCARAPEGTPVPVAAARAVATDTLFGRVYDTRDAPAARIMGLQLRDGTHFVLGGHASIQMRALANVGAVVEVWVAGTRDSATFYVDEFEVRRVGGEPVDDGFIVVTGNRLALITRTDERREVTDPPPSLRYLAGSRIWIVRATPRTMPAPFGIIVRK